MKKLPLLLIVGCISATISCKKEAVTPDKVLNTVSMQSTTSNQPGSANTKFGALISNLSSENRIKVCNALGAEYVRQPIILKDFDGRSVMMDKYEKNGFKVLLNLNYDRVRERGGNKVAKPFPTNMTEYKNLVGKVLDKYKPEIAVIENEEINDLYHTGKIEDYITELKTAIEVCKYHGVKVTDGGLAINWVSVLVYQNYIKLNRVLDAVNFAKLALTDRLLSAAKGNGSKDDDAK